MFTHPITFWSAPAGGGGFSPLDLASLHSWWDFSDLATITDDGGSPARINSITDKSGGGHTLSKATLGPQTGVDTLNSLNVSKWTAGTGEKLVTSGLHQFDDFTLFVVYRFTANVSARRLFDHNYQNGFWLGRQVSSGTPAGDGGGIREGSSPFGHYLAQSIDVWRIIAMRRTGGTKLIYGNDGASVSASVGSTATTLAKLALGNDISSTDGTTPMTGNQAEVVLCNDTLSQSDFNALGTFLANKWSLTWTDL